MSLLLALLTMTPGRAPPDFARYPPCAPEIVTPCIVPSPRLDRRTLDRMMAGRLKIWWISGDVLTLVARPTQGWAVLCCGLQTPLEPIAGSDFATISVRVPDMDEAVFDISFSPGSGDRNPPIYRGARAPPAPDQVAALAGTVEIHAIQSAALSQTRAIRVYVPPGAAGARDIPVIYLADGGSPGFLRIAERMIVSGRIFPVIIVGIDSAPGGSLSDNSQPDPRSLEYLPGHDQSVGRENRYVAHSRFVTDEVLPFVEAHYPVARTSAGRTVGGWSSGGQWALSMAATRPDLFGNLISLSMAGMTRELGLRLTRGKMFFGAGAFETGRDTAATRAAAGAREGGAEVRLRIIPAGHSFTMWDIYWAEALDWMFAPRPAPRR